MNISRKTTRTEVVVVEGDLDILRLYDLVQSAVPDAPPDATIELYVRIPGGGDWSSTDLELDLNLHVHFKVSWKVVS